MHKTGACLPKLGQADPLGQALLLDPRLPPEQLLAQARGCILRQRGCNLSNAMSKKHVCYDYKRLLVVYAYQFRFEILPKHNGLRLGLPLKCFGRHSRGFAGLVRVALVSTINFPFLFSIYAFRVGLNYNSDLNFSKNFVKNTVGYYLSL
jgi:hypothetical protein